MNDGLKSPRLTAASYGLFHCPYFTKAYGTTPEAERRQDPASEYCASLDSHTRNFAKVLAYAPNQVFIGNMDPLSMPERPWYTAGSADGPPAVSGQLREAEGPFGAILDETALYGLIKYADVFDLAVLERGFAQEAAARLRDDVRLSSMDFSKIEKGEPGETIDRECENGALPLKISGKIAGCVKSAHPSDVNLCAHTMLENLSAKATGMYALFALLYQTGIDAESVDYIIETSEEACGDINQRGGGNFAKAIGELCGLKGATGSDVRSFCAGPVHGLLHAASLTASGVFRKVVVLAGGTTAKLGMNSKKHMEKGLPVLEDVMGAFALLIEAGTDSGLLIRANGNGLAIRLDIVGRHKIGSGASPQAVIGDLVANPLYDAGLAMGDVDYYAPELQNPEITEAAGAGNVTLANLKMIAAMAVMKKEIAREDMDGFISKHGIPGWAPTQGHIPSGIPALGWFLRWAREGKLGRCMVIGKGSLFLGRMTNLFDGVSLVLEADDRPVSPGKTDIREADVSARAAAPKMSRPSADTLPDAGTGTIVIGLTIPGTESGAEELYKGAEQAMEQDASLSVRFFGEPGGNPKDAQREMENALAEVPPKAPSEYPTGNAVSAAIGAAVTFHYPFPIGLATVGLIQAPGTGRDLFIATTTGTVSTDRIEALVLNAVLGTAAAKASGIQNPKVGFLNLEGAAAALNRVKGLKSRGWNVNLAFSARGGGEELLRGNDILAGTCDVVVCDSLTGNAVMKLVTSFPTSGLSEVTGCGYGPGLGVGLTGQQKPVFIISRASSASVVAGALNYAARLVRGGIAEILRLEFDSAAQAGLSELLSAGKQDGRRRQHDATEGCGDGTRNGPPPGNVVPKKTVTKEIEGIDVLELDAAVAELLSKGLYAEAGMGCTGPVILVAPEDLPEALRLLHESRFIQETKP